MAQMTRDGRKVVDQLLADLERIRAIAKPLDRKQVIFDPVGAANALEDIRGVVARLERRINEDVTPLLERAERNREAAAVPERIAELERRLEALEKAQKVVPLRREA